MDVVQVSHLYRPSIGGIENYGHRLTSSLEENGHSVDVITTSDSLRNEQSPLSRESHVTYCETTARVLRNPFSLELFRAVRESDADIYHLHSPWYLSSMETVLALPRETPMVMTVHGFQPFRTLPGKALEVLYRPVARRLLDAVDQVIALGVPEKRRLVEEIGVSPAKVSVIPNGIHPAEHDVAPGVVERFRETFGVDPSKPTVAFVSRLVPVKNPGVLVESVTEHLDDLELEVLVIGNGTDEYVSELQRRSDGRIHFLANLRFEELQAAYHASDVFVMLSESEGLPTVLLEAMNARLPIITTPVGAIPDVIDSPANGWLLDDPPSARSLARAIRYYVDDESERLTVGERNREYVRRSFDWADIAREIESVYRDVLDRSAPPRMTE